jgi:hypothetical protein
MTFGATAGLLATLPLSPCRTAIPPSRQVDMLAGRPLQKIPSADFTGLTM